MSRVPWKTGDRLTHRENPALGTGRVVSVEGRVLEVDFPAASARLRLQAESSSLQPLAWKAGRAVRHLPTGVETTVAALVDGERAQLDDGRVVPLAELWPVDRDRSLAERLAAGDVDPVDDFALRLDALHLARLREADGLGTFLGGRIRLFPHQLHVAEAASAVDPVRWLLADEVGLGKTVEACLVLNRLVRTGRVERCLVVAPGTLVVQWLGELWRKYHQVFALLDDERLGDVERDFGGGFNPFDVHRRAVIALETLVERPRLTKQAVEAGIDLLVVDEAHRLRRPRGHAGDARYRAIEPIARLGRHVLLLSATPLEDDAHGFFRLLQLLRPDEFPAEEEFEARLAKALPLPRCTSSTRRVDVGGLPPRVPRPVDVDAPLALEAALDALPAGNALEKKRKLERWQRAVSSGAALGSLLGPGEDGLREAAAAADAADPRLRWLLGEARGWKEAGDKTLVFVAHKETLDLVRSSLSHGAQLASAAFHEELSATRRDIEVAQFRLPSGPSLLVSTECGGEGRNFEFCTRLVLFDLPWSPVVVEQRIGRLDRIGRARDVEIVYFRARSGVAAEVARRFEEVGIFREPLAGLEPELASLGQALGAFALAPAESGRALEEAVHAAEGARSRVREAAYAELHRDRYRPEMGPAILSRVPGGLDDLNRDVVVALAERLGFGAEPHADESVWSIDFGNEALVDSLPGVAGGSSFLGTFERARAVADETLDFFAAGHPLVEGLLAHLDESPLGRVAVLRVGLPGATGIGLLALYRSRAGFDAVALDAAGRRRPEWLARLTARPLRTGRVAPAVLAAGDWAAHVRRLAAALAPDRRPVALAALVAS